MDCQWGNRLQCVLYMFCLFSCVAVVAAVVVVVFVVCVCVSASSFLALSLSSSVRRRRPRCGSFRFGGFKYYVMFSARDKRHLFMSFLEVWTPSNGAIYLRLSSLSLSLLVSLC